MKRKPTEPIRVLIAADSAAQRELLVGMLNSNSMFEAVGVVGNGRAAITAAQQLRPHVIAMDIHLPLVDGYAATRQIMQQCPTPIVLMSSSDELAQRSIEALAAGALAAVAKPRRHGGAMSTSDTGDDWAAFLTTLRLMADVQVVTRYPARQVAPDQNEWMPEARRSHTESHTPTDWSDIEPRSLVMAPKVLAMAASTGGPAALQTVLRNLGMDFPLPILVVQHIARGFIPAFAEWLDSTVPLPVRIAGHGERLLGGCVYLAPEDNHLTVGALGIAVLRLAAPGDRFCPSADLLFDAVARVYGAQAIGLVLSGMGDDGTRGLLSLRAAGALTLAQDAASCVVYGMPRSAVEAGAIVRSEPLESITSTICRAIGQTLCDKSAG
jgi:two-component system chemotaxis response regulator CheB